MGEQVGLYWHRVPDRGELHAGAVLWVLLPSAVDAEVSVRSKL